MKLALFLCLFYQTKTEVTKSLTQDTVSVQGGSGLGWVQDSLGELFPFSSNAKQIAEVEPAGTVNSCRLELEGVAGVQADH